MLRAAAGVLIALCASAAQAQTYAIQAGHLIVDASVSERGASTLIVTDGRIVRIEDGATAPAGATVVDLRDKTVMPGLIDVHVHLTSDANLPWYETLRPKYSESYAAVTGVKNARKLPFVHAGQRSILACSHSPSPPRGDQIVSTIFPPPPFSSSS